MGERCRCYTSEEDRETAQEERQQVVERLGPFSEEGRAMLLYMDSNAVTDDMVPHGSLDVVFLDGDHSRDGLQLDFELWVPRVRPGGIVAGHDFGAPFYPDVYNVISGVL